MKKIFEKLNKILNTNQKRAMTGIVILLLIGGVLESLGISMIVPVMTIIVDPDAMESLKNKNAFFVWLFDAFSLNDTTRCAAFFMTGLILIFIIKNVFLFFVTKVQLKFVYTNQFTTSRKMMINYMNRPYEYYLNADTTVIQRSITSDVNNMYGLILNLLQLISEIIVFVCLVILLLLQDFAMTVTIASVLVVTLLIIKFFIKPIMTRAGEDNQNYYSGLFKWIEQSVSGIKEIKIADKENYFINSYADCGNGYVRAVQKYNLYNSVPRLVIETVAICSMVLYMLVLMNMGTPLKSMLPQITVMAAAAARLLPSANRINNYLTSIAYFEPFFFNVSDNLNDEINDENTEYDEGYYRIRANVTALPVKEKIELKDIVYKYPGSDVNVLDGAGMVIPVGKSVGIVGTSGAGKTTAVDVLLGLLNIESGAVLADGIDIKTNYKGWLKNLGYIPQSIFMLDSTIRKNVAFGVPDDEIDDDMVWRALAEASLDEFVKSLPEGLDTGIGERGIRLSGGQRQRIGIARALYDDPEVLILDEATSALDGDTESAIMESINSLHGKKTLIIIAHRLQTIEKCDIVYRVEDGRIVAEK